MYTIYRVYIWIEFIDIILMFFISQMRKDIMSVKDLYIQNITVSKHDNHSNSFQVKFPKVFTNYPLGAVRVEDQRFIDWGHYKFTLWQTQLNFVVFCVNSAWGVSAEQKPMIR